MKKKVGLIVIVLLICSALFGIANTLQKNLASNNNTKDTVKQEAAADKNNEVTSDNSNKITDNTKVASNTSTNSPANSTAATSAANAANSSKKDASKPSNAGASNTKVTSSNNSTKTATQTAAVSNPQPASTQKNTNTSGPANFVILDAVHNKTIYSAREDFSGMSVADITIKILNSKGISKRTVSGSSGVYFSMIAGLKERDQSVGPYSGWCFFVNGKKAGTGASSYILKPDDSVIWKYLQDGVSN